MKKTLIIGGSVLLGVLVLGGVWWYLLMNGRPDALSDIPNPFATSGGAGFPEEQNSNDLTDQPRALDVSLRKIASTPVAGATFVTRDDGDFVRYVEQGTGHIFEVNLEDGTAARITNTTVPRTTRAVWSPGGGRAALTAETGAGGTRVFAATIERTDGGEYSLTTSEIEPAAANLAFAETGEVLYYTVTRADGTTGYAHNLVANTRTERFTTPLRDIAVTWNPQLTAYTKPTAHLPGYAYSGESLARIAGGQPGLTVLQSDSAPVFSYLENGTFVSYAGEPGGVGLTVVVFPEKCAADPVREHTLWCGAPVALSDGTFPDQWYQGVASLDDIIWQVDLENGSATLVAIPSEDVGETIDIIDMQVHARGDFLLFINKKDGSLWVQETL